MLDRFNRHLWLLTRHSWPTTPALRNGVQLHAARQPFPGETIHPGPYRIGKRVEDVNTYRVGHPLAQRVLDRAKAASTPVMLTFN